MSSRTSSSPLWVTISYLKDQKGRLAAALGWRSIFILVPMQLPIITGAIVDGLSGENVSLYGFPIPASDTIYLLQVASLGLLGIAILYGMSSYMHGISRARLSRNFVANLRKQVFEKNKQHIACSASATRASRAHGTCPGRHGIDAPFYISRLRPVCH